MQRGVQWRRNLRNLPIRQAAAAAAAAGKQPQPASVVPQPQLQPEREGEREGEQEGEREVNREQEGEREVNRELHQLDTIQLLLADMVKKISIMHLSEIEEDTKLKDFYMFLKTLKLKKMEPLLDEWLRGDKQYILI